MFFNSKLANRLGQFDDNWSFCTLGKDMEPHCGNIIIKNDDQLRIITIYASCRPNEGRTFTVSEMKDALKKLQPYYFVQVFDRRRGVLCLQNIAFEVDSKNNRVVITSDPICSEPECNRNCLMCSLDEHDKRNNT